MSVEDFMQKAQGPMGIGAQIRECVSRRDFAGALGYAGKNDYPSMLREWWEAGLLKRPELRELLAVAWSMPDYPTRNGIRWWVSVFKAAGFVSDKEGAQVPNSDVTVYRGCFPMFRFSLSWTTNNKCAEWFAHEYSAKRYVYPPDIPPRWRAPPAVYRASVAPRHILAMFYEREEEEVVVNPWGLPCIEQIG